MAGRVGKEAARSSQGDALADLAAGEDLPILLVDDRPENLQTLEAVLSPLGFPLVTATSGSQALRLLLERDFALILLDVRMPGLDGIETAELIKSRDRTADMPIVFLTAAQDEADDILRGYSVGAVDYVLKPFDPDMLRSKVAVFAELEAGRRALKRSEALLRGAFEAAPIGKTVLDPGGVIIRSNPAFARLVGLRVEDVEGLAVADLCHAEDVPALTVALSRLGDQETAPAAPDLTTLDVRLRSRQGREVWVGIAASVIDSTELGQDTLLMIQWVDLTARRRAENARAELLLEQAARAQAEAIAERLSKLQAFSSAFESLTLEELLPELAVRLVSTLEAEAAEVEVTLEREREAVVRAVGGTVEKLTPGERAIPDERWEQAPIHVEGVQLGVVRVARDGERPFDEAQRVLLREAADRAGLSIRRAQLHEEEHRIAVELQRGLIPNRLPSIRGLKLAAHYEAAGVGAEVGGDWYDAFALPEGRLGLVLGDVAGSGIRAASAMGQLRSVTRAYALGDGGERDPGDVLTRVSRYHAASDDPELFTILYAIVDPGEGTVTWASAGHPPPLLLSGRETRFLEGAGGLMGVEETVYEIWEESLASGDTLLLYTDGLVERRGESLDTGLERLAAAAGSGPQDPARLCAHVLELLTPEAERRADDVTAVVVRLA